MLERLFTLGIAIFMTMSVAAQTSTSAIKGNVVDQDGVALVGATIVATHTPSGTQYGAIANKEGVYVIKGMRAGGPYKITASYVGYKESTFKLASLSLGEPYILNFKLSANIIEEIEVRGGNNSLHTSFSAEQLENTPTTDRSIDDIVRLSPLAMRSKNSKGGITFAGTNNRYNSFQIDGIMANDVYGLTSSGTNGGMTNSNPISLENIEQIQVVIAPYDIRQSGFTGGGINAITKSGTNTLKGSAYSYYRNENLVGKGPSGESYPEQSILTTGAALSGAIIKNKLFFYVSGEYTNNETPAKEYTSENTPGFVSNEQLNQIADKYKSLTGYKVAELGAHTPKIWSTNILARIDYNINQRNQLMLRYSFANSSLDNYTTSSGTYYFNDASYEQRNQTHSLVAELQSRINNNLFNELRLGWTRVRDWRDNAAAEGAPTVNITVSNKWEQNGATQNKNTTVLMGNESSSYANQLGQDIFTLTDNVSLSVGSHDLTFGTHNEFYHIYNVYAPYATGQWSFSSIDDFMTNTPSQFDYTYFADEAELDDKGNWGAKFGAAQLGLYLQDEWSINSRTILTMGLRADMPLFFNRPSINNEFNQSSVAKQYGVATGDIPSGKILISPRVGINYYADAKRNILIRAGAGIFTGRAPFVWLSNQFSNTGIDQIQVSTTDRGKIPTLGGKISSQSVKDLGLTATSATINVVDKDFKLPQVFRVNAAVEWNIGYGWESSFEVLYSKSFNNIYLHNIDFEKTSNYFQAVEGNPASYTPLYKNNTSYSNIVYLDNTNKGYSYSLTAQLKKSFDWGLSLNAAYTFGHSYAVFDGGASVAYSNWKYCPTRDPNDRELTISNFDVPHRIIASANYHARYGRAGRWGSHISLIYEGHSGNPYSLTYFYNQPLPNKSGYSINGDGHNGNDLIYIPTKEDMDKMDWVSPEDKASFEALIQSEKRLRENRGSFSKRNMLRMPFESQFDLSFTQDFYYNTKRGGKISLMCSVMNLANLLNKDWGKYYETKFSISPLTIQKDTKLTDSGDVTARYAYYQNYKDLDDYLSRWRMQLGLKVTF